MAIFRKYSTRPRVQNGAALDRRALLKLGVAGAGALAVPSVLGRVGLSGSSALSTSEMIGGTFVGDYRGTTPNVPRFTVPLPTPPVLGPTSSSADTDTYRVTLRQANVEILPGKSTAIWGYNGITPGPTIKQRSNRKAVLQHVNTLPEATSCHLHGSPTVPQFDGHPEILVKAGETLNYQYPTQASARTLWYHDHAMHTTARHVYQGLAGFYLVSSAAEDNLGLPSGQYDVPLLIQDKLFTGDGTLVYDDEGHSDLMGDITLVNGAPWPVMEVDARKYRFRFLVGSNSRGYELALSNGMPFTMVATDAGLMPKPQRVTSFIIGMAERYEAVVDFSSLREGTEVVLKNRRGDAEMGDVMKFKVVRKAADDSRVPDVLNPTYAPIAASSATQTGKWRFDRSGGMWTINGRIWETGRVDAKPALGSTEIWELTNNSGGWFHPVHIHLVDFQILSRNGRAAYPYERGWKDVAYVGENETVRVIMKFGPHRGKYVMHCHNVVHEDHDMMNQWEVV